MSTCKTCKYWERHDWPDDLWGRCERTKGTNGASDDAETLAWVESEGKCYAWLNTYESFGCNQYSEGLRG